MSVASWRRQHRSNFGVVNSSVLHGSQSIPGPADRFLEQKSFDADVSDDAITLAVLYQACGGSTVHNSLQNYAKSTALDEYLWKMSLVIQIDSLGADKLNLEIHKTHTGKSTFYFPFVAWGGNWILDPLSYGGGLQRAMEVGSKELRLSKNI